MLVAVTYLRLCGDSGNFPLDHHLRWCYTTDQSPPSVVTRLAHVVVGVVGGTKETAR
jgi:hypothetical protein